ncbi:hypothetical protein BC351_14865 [Paenibacillus ferrarius]|uniref:ApeA N-terminal domain-containing protein n=1 Tax=Paenibacillus ferrarius TaxID=1469647 RepID=A0A1V4HRD7_9BACL|nr:hypothetical protein [Paenibacillus ferrarius]OPH61221.1 hypothetical protein BC351_14865 [Paenibacillus ferrarius]
MGRVLFESEELKKRFYETFLYCEENNIDFMVDSIDLDPYSLGKDFILTEFLNKEDFEEDVYITDNTEIRVILPHSEDDEEISFGYFYQAIRNALQGRIEENKQFISPYLYLVHVSCDFILLEKLNQHSYSIKQQWGDTDIHISITQGLTSFGLRLTMDGEYDEYYPPVLSNETFIEVLAKDKMDPQTFEEIVQSYIFELQATFPLNVQRSIRITGIDYYDDEDEVAVLNKQQIKMRPLMRGKGISSLLKIYNSCNEVQDNEFRILNYTKVIEYVSQTVIRKEMLDSVLKKLYSPKVLQPNATYILELEKLYDEHRNNKKDHQAIKLTIETCCDLADIIDTAPVFLKKHNELKKNRDNKELRSACFDELANAVSDTRNMLAHAKTNYKLKGNECPNDQLSEFADCLKVVAIQVIRWFARQHEDSRII